MPEDLFRGEWMPLYWDRFVKDVQDLATEQIGAYLLLLNHQWQHGSVPADLPRLANIARLPVPRMRSALEALGDRFQPHSTAANSLFNPFMERVREEQRLKFERGSVKGKTAAEHRWKHTRSNAPSNATGNAPGNATSNASSSATGNAPSTAQSNAFGNADQENRESQLATLAESAREATETTKATKSPAFTLAEWFLKTGLGAEVIPQHEGLDPIAWCHKQLEAAEKLVAVYTVDDIKTRSQRMFEASKSRRIRRPVTVVSLLTIWDWSEIRGEAPSNSQPASTESDDFIRRVSARTKGAA